MTVSSSASRNQYTATAGQTVFAYTFEIVTDDDIVVLKNGVTLTKTADYTVSGVGVDSGGNVTLVVGATAGDILTLYRDMAYERLTDYTNAGDFLAADVNNDFDRLWIATQQVNEEVNRSIKAPVTDPLTIDMTLPDKADRLGKYLRFNSTTGNPEAGDVSGLYATAGLNVYNFTGDGSDTTFTLGIDPGTENNTQVYIDGVYQQKNTYNVSGKVITFSAAPPNLSTIEVMVVEPQAVGNTTASSVSFTQAGSSTERNVQLKLQESVSVKDFGAAGDGVTDDTAAIQAAINYASPLGKTIIIPDGSTILVTSALTVPSHVALEGTGTISYTGSGFMFPQSEAMTMLSFKNLTLKGSSQSNSLFSYGFDLDRIIFSNCEIRDFSQVFEDDGTTLAVTFKQINVNGCFVQDCKSGFEFSANVIQDFIGINNFFKSISSGGSVYCFLLGNNNTTGQDARGDYVVSNNTFKNITSTNLTAEVHAIICYGKRATISGNIIDDLNNAGTTGAESIYTKCRFSAITGNSIEDGGVSQGAIAIKGQDRGGSGAPFGYGCAVTGNVIKNSAANATGIFLQNESIVCTGNYIEGSTAHDIFIATTAASAVNVSDNTISLSQAEKAIASEADCDELIISNNVISNMIGKASTACYAILIKTATTGCRRLSIFGNTISVDSTSTSTAIDAIQIDTENDGSTFEHVSIIGNNADMSDASNGRGIRILGEETIDNFLVSNNQITADGTREFDIASTVTLTGVINFKNNTFGGTQAVTSAFTLDWEDVGQPIVYTGTGTAKFTLPEANVGAEFVIINGDTTGQTVGFQRSGTDVFRGSTTEATIADEGSIACKCFVAGTWDITSATSAVTYA